jgi:hypothetical protein
VKLLRSDPNTLVFQLASSEKTMLLGVLQRYPCVPPAHHRLSRGAAAARDQENQRLLDEALAEQRARNQRQLQTLLAHPATFQRIEKGWRLTLRQGDFEWLIQVLNDVRVGSWLALGAPEELPRDPATNEPDAPHVYAMELAGLFQMMMLEAVEGGAGP